MLSKMISERSPLTLGDVIEIAEVTNNRVIDVILAEAMHAKKMTKAQVLQSVMSEFDHNFLAIERGLTDGESPIMGTVGADLTKDGMAELFKDDFINRALIYTLSAQVGNHVIGLKPCAGTGDSCPYTGFLKAMIDLDYSQEEISEIAMLMLKIGSYFRVGKVSSGCNMEGFGAGSAAVSAAVVSLKGGSPRQMERAMVLAISPTIAVPCTPRVMVPGLCATHIGGAIVIGNLAAGLALYSDIEVNVPIDVMFVLASEVHKVSAKQVVPVVVKYLRSLFKTKPNVENLISERVKIDEIKEMKQTMHDVQRMAKDIAAKVAPVTNTLGDAVVGGSSQAVGSPTNAARIAHFLAKDYGKISKVKVELYPELFARRGINVPGIIMGAVFGSPTSDYKKYKTAIDEMNQLGIAVEIVMAEEYGLQRITIEAERGVAFADTLNRGGGRLVLRDAAPSLSEAQRIAVDLGIQLV